jgi:BirA family biotin operon repressor/biotin-[acetyl-CoA-carboxylase] ligase
LFSLAFQPVSVAADQQIRINWYTALIWIKCCKRFSIDAQIKWPNDIFVGQQKLGGILIEQQIQGSIIAWSVVGCGINVNATPALPNACSIFELTNVRFQPKTVLNEFLDLYNGQIQLLYGDFQELKTAFEAELYGKGTIQEFIDAQQVAWHAKVIGVDEQGKLLLEKNDVVQAYDLQQVRLVLPA